MIRQKYGLTIHIVYIQIFLSLSLTNLLLTLKLVGMWLEVKIFIAMEDITGQLVTWVISTSNV